MYARMETAAILLAVYQGASLLNDLRDRILSKSPTQSPMFMGAELHKLDWWAGWLLGVLVFLWLALGERPAPREGSVPTIADRWSRPILNTVFAYWLLAGIVDGYVCIGSPWL